MTSIFLPIADIFSDSSCKKQGLLRDKTNLLTERLEAVIPHINTIYFDFSKCNIVKTRNQLHKRGLARSGRSDKSNGFTWFSTERNIVQNRIFRLTRIGKGDIFKFQIAVGCCLSDASFIWINGNRHIHDFFQTFTRNGCTRIHGEEIG